MLTLVNDLEDLDSRLSIGLNFQDYSTKVADAKVAYDKIDVPSIAFPCLTKVAAPSETALNDYISAYSTWNDCVNNVNCTNDSIKSKLQAKWAAATKLITSIKAALR